jgi:MerR family transcriptional regulator, copper efflux regulator
MARDGLLIGEVATRSGLSRKALRLYETRGILPPSRRTPSGYRTYPLEVVGVLHFVAQARRLGLTLAEIGSIVALRCAKPGPCGHVRALLERKVAELDSVRRELRRILDSWDASSQRQGVICQQSRGRVVTRYGKSLALPCLYRMSRNRHGRRNHPHRRGQERRRPQESGVERVSRCHQVRPSWARVI